MPGGDVNPGGQEHHTCTAALGGQGVSPSLQTQRQKGVIPVILLGALSICDMCLASQGWEADNTTIWKEKRRAPPGQLYLQFPHPFPGEQPMPRIGRPLPNRNCLFIYLFICTRTVLTLFCLLVFNYLYI